MNHAVVKNTMTMKWLYILFSFAIILFSCKKKEEAKPKTDEELAIETVSRIWKVKTISTNVPDDKALYSTIVFKLNTDGTYSQLNPSNAKNPPAKKESGTWRFANTARTEIVLDEGTSETRTLSNLIIPSASASTLGFSFEGLGNKNVKIIIEIVLFSE